MKIIFLTFGDSYRYANSLNRIKKEAETIGWFDEVHACRETDLDKDFYNKYARYMHSTRGFGYWIWKSQIVLQHLETCNEGDILVYCDSGCTLNKQGEQRFKEYITMLSETNEYDNIGFQLEHLEHTWTKGDLLDLYPNLGHTKQLIGGIFLLKKSGKTISLIKEWRDLVCSQNFHLVDDSPSRIPNHPSFCENRHDQSCFSLIRKTRGCIILEDETWKGDNYEWNHSWIMSKPIHAKRIRG